MKKYWIGIVSSMILMLFLMSPSSVNAAENLVGRCCAIVDGVKFETDAYCNETFYRIDYYNTRIFSQNGWPIYYYYNGVTYNCTIYNTWALYLPTINNPNQYGDCLITNDEATYIAYLPEELQPVTTVWDDFYDLYESIFGYRPLPGSIIDILRSIAEGDHSQDTDIVFPSMTPTPTPTPSPTPIPVQTIFVPDGNGNTTIIYQYPDPTTGVITQSPYNPNITNNIEVNCDCAGNSGGGSNPFGSSPQDPYTLLADLNWGTALGVDMSDNPLTEADNSQTTIKGVAEEYTSSVEVMSNSFNVLPFKWITLAGLLGGILIIAGLLRTFLGG